MDFQQVMETFAEAWVAANTQTPLTEAAEAQVNLLLNPGSFGQGFGPAMEMGLESRRNSSTRDQSSVASGLSTQSQHTHSHDDDSSSPLTTSPSFGGHPSDFKSGIPSATLGIVILFI